MEREMPLSGQQLAFLVFLLLPGSSLVFIPGLVAGQSAWLAELLGLLPGLYILVTVFKLHSLFPGQRITTISTTVLGKGLGTFLNILFMWSISLFLLSFLFDIAMLLRIIYPFIPRLILYPLIVLPCVYCIYLGLTVLGRMGEMFFWLSLGFIVLALIINLPLVDLSKLRPIVTDWKPLLGGALYAADLPFDEVVIFGLFLPLVLNLKNEEKRVYQWYMVSAITLIILDLITISALGPTLTNLFQFPIFEMFRIAGFGEFRRLELGFLLLWFVVGITAIIISMQGLLFVVQDVLGLRDYKPIILPVGLGLIVFTAYMFPSDIAYQSLSFKYVPIYTFPINLFYPTILLAAAKIRKTSLNAKGAPSSAGSTKAN